MHVTELLVTGYIENEPVVAVNLAPDCASVVLTTTSDDGETVVESAFQQATDAFAAVRELMEGIVGASALTAASPK